MTTAQGGAATSPFRTPSASRTAATTPALAVAVASTSPATTQPPAAATPTHPTTRRRRPSSSSATARTVQVLEISIANATVRINSTRVDFTSDVGDDDATRRNNKQLLAVNKTWGDGLPNPGPYFLSEEYEYRNLLRVESCNVQVDLLGGNDDDSRLVASCTAICPTVGPQNDTATLVWDGSCAGIRCCQASIDIG